MNDERKYYENELAVYRNIEYWGLTLITGAIGAVTYSLVEWIGGDYPTPPLKHAPPWVTLSPVILGSLGAVSLRIANLRGKFAEAKIAPKEPTRRFRPGFLGLCIAAGPLLAGVGGSCLAAAVWGNIPGNALQCWNSPMAAVTIGGSVGLAVCVVHFTQRLCQWRKAPPPPQV